MKKKIRKIHRYLGIFIGLQFIMWTVSGLYFSWTDIDQIHGDNFRNLNYKPKSFNKLISPSKLNIVSGVNSIELKEIDNQPFYWINKNSLYNATTGHLKNGITENEALSIAKKHMLKKLIVKDIKLITQTDKHHEYREKLLPAYVISYNHKENIKAYVSISDGSFQTVRHRNWRWFDFLWMTHTMDYQGRDNFNTIVLRVFSLLGLLTVLSGFVLWFTSSKTIRKLIKNKK
ncbi:PepSY domain-containing protein [Lutibacter sp. B1]|jgi:hypothetical protein|uniref:PepSY domain-containing protein n=1 Tax=Lutibacter sp. B1 TaxID=2725996 RepID=UPI0014565307|nr:PepSY domain-containing protein [Lutibacter sp. B1]NLP59025.1 hypothetical protein [Lutibacter sp. B1]